MRLILGSSSPRRKEILSFFSYPFTQANPDFDERQVSYIDDPIAFVREVAEKKALSLGHIHPDSVILTADTVVSLDGQIFLKPQNLKEAKSMLKNLVGKEHQVYTGICIWKKNGTFFGVEKTGVTFQKLTDAQIDTYIKATNPLDKAGGYAIQGLGSLIVKRIDGCYYNVMGLPIQTVRQGLIEVGIDLWDYLQRL